jgi:dienelactone hydrolase
MSGLDATLLAATLLTAALWLFAGGRAAGALRWAPLALLVLAAAQFARHGLTWQFVPLYALGLLLSALAGRGRIGWLGRAAVALLALASLGAWSILAVPRLPAPAGPFPVGTATFRWVDAARPEAVTERADDRRNVVVQAWYPAAAGGRHSLYMDGLGRLPPSVNGLPRFVFRRFGEVDTHAAPAAAISTAQARWPVVVFSPGYGASRAFYTSLVADLASRGFVVLALDHPYEGPAVELADGTVATPIEHFIPGDPNRIRYMETRIGPRVGDVRFLLDRVVGGGLGRIDGHVDPDRIAVIGHSFGGATAALALAEDPRPRAGADIDGMLYGGVERVSLGRPFLFLESDHAVTRHPPLYFQRRDGLLSRLAAPGEQHEITGTNHLSFTDAEYFFAPPVRPLVRRVLGGSRPSSDTQRLAAAQLERFLRRSLP